MVLYYDPVATKFLDGVQINCETMPVGPNNKFGVGFVAKETPLLTEKQAQRNVDTYKSRSWKVVNYNSRNKVTGVNPGSHILCVSFVSVGLVRERCGMGTCRLLVVSMRHLWSIFMFVSHVELHFPCVISHVPLSSSICLSVCHLPCSCLVCIFIFP